MADADFKIIEYFDYEDIKVYYSVLKKDYYGNDYHFVQKFDSLNQATQFVRMARKHKEPVVHYVED